MKAHHGESLKAWILSRDINISDFGRDTGLDRNWLNRQFAKRTISKDDRSRIINQISSNDLYFVETIPEEAEIFYFLSESDEDLEGIKEELIRIKTENRLIKEENKFLRSFLLKIHEKEKEE